MSEYNWTAGRKVEPRPKSNPDGSTTYHCVFFLFKTKAGWTAKAADVDGLSGDGPDKHEAIDTLEAAYVAAGSGIVWRETLADSGAGYRCIEGEFTVAH